ncbi:MULTISPECIES: hypothetical protein [unclassified Pseudoalteromonas]|uniref:hypothetical protein n=1 Tax=unclassified Pseudoalteromonas TaxID=194690 RepID=UPI0016032B97|nr:MULTISPECIES: hypothetical protein [unclassified Pseudoalteromonas]MBB1295476.1 hypothetical protein [Pseudoalteromonas sp. SR41-4]MBB1410262.1 hypothetical protein [Pseudoalteromonas sp. SG44-17]|tara:strand:- start:22329 stop:22679 length:351 start_codon:yes stop_codon:yes gene_type:complete
MCETKSVSGYATTFVHVVAANVCGEIIKPSDLKSLDSGAGDLYCAASCGEIITRTKLKYLDALLIENNPALSGLIFNVYNEANDFLEPIYDLTELVSDPDYLAEQYEIYSLSEFEN